VETGGKNTARTTHEKMAECCEKRLEQDGRTGIERNSSESSEMERVKEIIVMVAKTSRVLNARGRKKTVLMTITFVKMTTARIFSNY